LIVNCSFLILLRIICIVAIIITYGEIIIKKSKKVVIFGEDGGIIKESDG